MQLSVFEIIGIQKSLNSITSKPLPAKTSFRLARLASKIDNEVKLAEDQRIKLIEKYGALDGKSATSKTVTPENMDAFTKEFTALLQDKIEVQFSVLSIEDLGSIEVAPSDLRNLTPLFAD